MPLTRGHLLAGAFALVLVAALAACGGAATEPAPAPPALEEPQAPEAGVEPVVPPPEEVAPTAEPPTAEAVAPAPEETGPVTDCTETNPHPIGQSIAETFDVTYEQVMTWFCAGDTFDDILLALQTHEDTGVPVEDLLARNREVGWDQVWEEIGYVEPET